MEGGAESVELSGPSAERLANTQRVIAALGPHGQLSLADLRSSTGLSRPTLTAILGELSDDGWIVQGDARSGASSAPGRPARPYSVNPDAGFVAGVDIGLHKVLVVIVDCTGTVRHQLRHDLDPAAPGDERIARVQAAITQAAAALSLRVSELLGLCLGVPGIVDESGRITRSSVIPDWTGFHVGRAVSKWSGCTVDVVNDANLAAAGERWAGAARLRDDVIYVLAGRRVSAGLIIGGQVHRGRNGASGEIGSAPAMFVDPPAILLGESASQDDPRIPEVFARAAEGDQDAQERVTQLCHRLGFTVENLAKILDPDVVVLGGGLSLAGAPLLEGVRAAVTFNDDVAPPIVLGELAETAVALGGAHAAFLTAARADARLRPLASAPAVLLAQPAGAHSGAPEPTPGELRVNDRSETGRTG
ncbi:ROK family transcriptional regulator [Phytoactinopolyspora mesophila]|nr:ROK family transcriptional regulator [Phytoactinopolyspora mesophila]